MDSVLSIKRKYVFSSRLHFIMFADFLPRSMTPSCKFHQQTIESKTLLRVLLV